MRNQVLNYAKLSNSNSCKTLNKKNKKLGLKAQKRAFRLYFFVFLFVFLFVASGSPCYTRLARFIRLQIYCLKTTNLLFKDYKFIVFDYICFLM